MSLIKNKITGKKQSQPKPKPKNKVVSKSLNLNPFQRLSSVVFLGGESDYKNNFRCLRLNQLEYRVA